MEEYCIFLKRVLNDSDFYFGIIVLSMLFVPISELFGELFYNMPYVFERAYLTALGLVGLLLFLSDICLNKKFSSISLVYTILVLLAGISVSFSTPELLTPFFISIGHTEELFHYYAYFFLLYSATKLDLKKHAKNLIISFIIVGCLHDFIGIFQVLGLRISENSYNMPEMHEQLRCIYGLTSHCNFYAAIATIFVSISCISYLLRKCSVFNVKWLFLIFLSSFCAICSSTRLGILGIGTSVSLLVIFGITCYAINRKKLTIHKTCFEISYYKIPVAISIIACSTIVVYVFLPHLLIPSIGEFLQDFSVIASDNQNFDQLGSFRSQVWRYTIEYIMNVNFLTGTGIGNFHDVFFTNPELDKAHIIVNFAHNEYLHIFATQGVISFLVYITFFSTCIVRSVMSIIKSNDLFYQRSKIIFLFVLLCYMVQAFFNCNIFETYFYFWILLGIAYIYEK
ncbi:O-antigen ligase family protein [Succinimonas sp.]|uniref:O-antigen ligase family protein n=1 Tax=Succinimonas sp. TaxID=1936151 RepID=UPI00387094EA